MNLQPSVFLERMGDPASWSGDWRRRGHYPRGRARVVTRMRIAEHNGLVVGMALRGHPSRVIAAVFCVSREAVDERLRPLGMKNAPGHVGRPPSHRGLDRVA